MSDAAKIKEVFQKYDQKQQGFITFEELGGVLKSLGGFHDAEIHSVFCHIDKNRDGKVQYEEFLDWILSDTPSQDDRARQILRPGTDDGILPIFFAFCGDGHQDMDGKSFMKLCKDCRLVDKKLTSSDVDLIFVKALTKGRRRITGQQFEEALRLVAERKGVSVDGVREAVIGAGPPMMHGTKMESVRFYDDKSTFTGVHAHHADGVDAGIAQMTAASGCTIGKTFSGSRKPMSKTFSGSQPPMNKVFSGNYNPGGTSRASSPPPRASKSPSIGRTRENESSGSFSASQNPQQASARRGPASCQDVFRSYCGINQTELDSKGFVKLCRDCHIIDKTCTIADMDLIFSRIVEKGQRRINMKQFEEAIWQLAERKGVEFGTLLAKVSFSQGPVLHGTQADTVRLHDGGGAHAGAHTSGSPEQASALPSPGGGHLASAGMRIVKG